MFGHILLGRADCTTNGDLDTCETPASKDKITWGVIIGVGVLLFGSTLGIVIFLHCRRTRRDKRDDVENPMDLDDYGLGEPTGKKAKKAKKAGQEPRGNQAAQATPPDAVRNYEQSPPRAYHQRQDPFGPSAELAYDDYGHKVEPHDFTR